MQPAIELDRHFCSPMTGKVVVRVFISRAGDANDAAHTDHGPGHSALVCRLLGRLFALRMYSLLGAPRHIPFNIGVLAQEFVHAPLFPALQSRLWCARHLV